MFLRSRISLQPVQPVRWRLTSRPLANPASAGLGEPPPSGEPPVVLLSEVGCRPPKTANQNSWFGRFAHPLGAEVAGRIREAIACRIEHSPDPRLIIPPESPEALLRHSRDP
jgi:hypothetical protein